MPPDIYYNKYDTCTLIIILSDEPTLTLDSYNTTKPMYFMLPCIFHTPTLGGGKNVCTHVIFPSKKL